MIDDRGNAMRDRLHANEYRSIKRGMALLEQEQREPGSVARDEALALAQALSICSGARSTGSSAFDREVSRHARELAEAVVKLGNARVHGIPLVASIFASGVTVTIKAPSRQVYLPPGAMALRLLAWFVSPRTIERVYGQTVADMREEHIEALAARRPRRARWISIRGHLSLLITSLELLPISLARRIYEIWKAI
jgi:hypothetical protein